MPLFARRRSPDHLPNARSWPSSLRTLSAWLVYRRLREHLVQEVLQALPPLSAKIRGRLVPELVQRALAHEPDWQTLAEETPDMRLATLAILLHRCVAQLYADNKRAEKAYEVLLKQVERAADEDARERVIKDYLRRHASSIWHYWGDVRALKRRLDLDALRERVDEIRYWNFSRLEVILGAVHGLWQRALTLAGDNRAEVLERAREARPLQFLLDNLRLNPRWPTRMIAGELAENLLRSPLATDVPAAFAQQLKEQILDAEEQPWVRRNAFRVLQCLAGEQAEALRQQLLVQVDSLGERDFVVRALLLDDLSLRFAQEPRAIELLHAHALRRDPSEHVRLTLAHATVRLPCDLPAVHQLLTVLADLEPHTGANESPKVRAQAVRSIGTLLRKALADEPQAVSTDATHLLHAATRLGEVLNLALTRAPAALVVRTTCRQIAQSAVVIARRGLTRECARLFGMWTSSLVYLRGHDTQGPRINEEAAAALEVLQRCLHPFVWEVHRHLQERVNRLRQGQRVKIPLDQLLATPTQHRPDQTTLDENQLGRILADLSRRDWGLYVHIAGRNLILQRGERFITRLWRIWHEIRTPAPNKRQAFTHSWGRSYHGALRAHPGRLDEVTPTVVPGERVTVELEGGWGRHLPLLDDFISYPTPSVEHPVRLYSSLGVTTVALRGNWWQRQWIRWRLSLAYAHLSEMRRISLGSDDPQERAAFLERLRRDYGAEVHFSLHPVAGNLGDNTLPTHLQVLFGERGREQPHGDPMAQAAAWLWPVWPLVETWFERNAHYFLTDQGNDQASLALFLFGMLGYFLVDGFRRRRRVDLARMAIPLSIGGWGTRGKSGTERLKAAVFHGLGYRVFSKTTGCEAMLIHSVAEGPEVEVFVFRPYGKATIWEQRDLLELAAQVKADVFMWECMALNPTYVTILQQEWMRDDITTLTNAYPDHEDIQGPAGMNVAQVIANFIPIGNSVICSEINFVPVLRDVAAEQGCDFLLVDEDDGEWIAQDMLALLPYQEHPRNIALVATMSECFGIERDLAIYNMGQYVVPDLGVLKTYPDVRVRGRVLRFINGCSANERTGFMNNWRRTGCDQFDAEKNPGMMVITVVNNREDRISRSEVFSRILVQDAAADRHVLIGTNLRGLMGYIEDALHEFLEATRVVSVRDYEGDGGDAIRRLDRLFKRLRIAPATQTGVQARFSLYCAGIGLQITEVAVGEVWQAAKALIERASALPKELAALRKQVVSDAPLQQAMRSALERHAQPIATPAPAEAVDPAGKDDVIEHFALQLSRMIAAQQLRLALHQCLQEKSAAGAEHFHRHLSALYRELFLDLVDVVEDPGTKGDQIIDRIARGLPPGTDVSMMGTQNIKGTGLDFVYRWTSLASIVDLLKKAESSNASVRSEALSQMLGFGDHGIVDLGAMRDKLPKLVAKGNDEAEQIKRLIEKTERLYEKKKAGLAVVEKKVDRMAKFYNWFEGWIEYLDGARRFHQSRSLTQDLATCRVSHIRAAIEMRELYDRTKGGWLAKKMSGT